VRGSLADVSGTTFRGDPYHVLDVGHDATAEDIKQRWRELAREHHPDRSSGDGGSDLRVGLLVDADLAEDADFLTTRPRFRLDCRDSQVAKHSRIDLQEIRRRLPGAGLGRRLPGMRAFRSRGLGLSATRDGAGAKQEAGWQQAALRLHGDTPALASRSAEAIAASRSRERWSLRISSI